jgi:hypothetical protein
MVQSFTIRPKSRRARTQAMFLIRLNCGVLIVGLLIYLKRALIINPCTILLIE